MTLTLVSLAALMIVGIFFRTACTAYKERKLRQEIVAAKGCEPPSPVCAKWPLCIDLIYHAFRVARKGQMMKFFAKVCEESGHTFELNILGARCVDTIAPENIEAILSSQFQDFSLGVRCQTFRPLLGEGIFTEDGDAWQRSRELLRPQFSKKRFDNFNEIKTQAENLLACMPDRGVVDLQPLFYRFTLDTTTYMLFGTSINSLIHADRGQKEARFAEAFQISQDFLSQRGRLVNFYWLIDGPKFRRSNRIVHEWLDETIQQALMSDEKEGSADDYTVLRSLMKQTRDPRVLRDQLLNVLLAGRDTTAACLSWTFRMLVRHPEVLEKLRNEVENVLGKGAEAREPERNDLKKMRYLSLVLKEVLRLYPSVPVNSREVVRTTTLPRGGGDHGKAPVVVGKGEYVGYSVYVMHRRKDLYGPDAHEFRPERWEVPTGQPFCLENIGWGYLPFNGGPRICLGQEFALTEASYAVVRILQDFSEVVLPEDAPLYPVGDEKQQLTLTLSSDEGCFVKVKRAARV